MKPDKYLLILIGVLVLCISYSLYNVRKICKTQNTYLIKGTEYPCHNTN